MALYDLNRTAGARPLGTLLTRLFAEFAAWNDGRATRKALSKLSDRELDDIGLVRGDLDTLFTPERR